MRKVGMTKYNLKDRSVSFWIDNFDRFRGQGGTIDVFDGNVLRRNVFICIKQNQPMKLELDTNILWTSPKNYKKHSIYKIIGDV